MTSDEAAPRILVVDDEQAVREFTERALQTAGYEVVVAAHGKDALDLVERRGPFDAFVLDMVMPGMNGNELAQKIRLVEPDARILYFTGYADKLFGEKKTLWEHEAFVEKPLTMKGLLEAVSLLLHGNLRHVDKARRATR
jgi:two-component system, cell cycle sensor histidine kinase and response regulator CckA